MNTKRFNVPNISCGHCVRTIELELSDLDGVEHVSADQHSKVVTVRWNEPASWEAIQATLREINYPAEGLIQIQ